jgi:hypothetical protein
VMILDPEVKKLKDYDFRKKQARIRREKKD